MSGHFLRPPNMLTKFFKDPKYVDQIFRNPQMFCYLFFLNYQTDNEFETPNNYFFSPLRPQIC